MKLEYYKVVPHGKKKRTVCPHNDACRCMTKDCYHCGWNPIVAKIRLEKAIQRLSEAKCNG